MNRLFTAIAVAVMVLEIHAVADATLINNANGTFSDTGSGYLWMTLGQFNNLTYSQAVAKLAPGFHAASAAELGTLTTDAPAIPETFATDLQAMGAISDRGMIWGLFGDGYQWAWRSSSDTHWNTNNSSAYGWENHHYSLLGGDSGRDLGLFAVNTTVNSTVPEPGTLLLLCTGLAVVAGMTRKRDK